MPQQDGRGASQRLFFALWPDDATRAALQACAPRQPRASGRPIPGEKLHLTVLFLGQTTHGVRQCIESAAAAVRCPPFVLKLTRTGYFPRSRVLWAGMAEVPEELAALHEALKAGARSCGCAIETRAYSPHITLLRNATGPLPSADRLEVIWEVREFALVASRSTAEGTCYETLKSWPLL
jgi:2'-5' RNA ligase